MSERPRYGRFHPGLLKRPCQQRHQLESLDGLSNACGDLGCGNSFGEQLTRATVA